MSTSRRSSAGRGWPSASSQAGTRAARPVAQTTRSAASASPVLPSARSSTPHAGDPPVVAGQQPGRVAAVAQLDAGQRPHAAADVALDHRPAREERPQPEVGAREGPAAQLHAHLRHRLVGRRARRARARRRCRAGAPRTTPAPAGAARACGRPAEPRAGPRRRPAAGRARSPSRGRRRRSGPARRTAPPRSRRSPPRARRSAASRASSGSFRTRRASGPRADEAPGELLPNRCRAQVAGPCSSRCHSHSTTRSTPRVRCPRYVLNGSPSSSAAASWVGAGRRYVRSSARASRAPRGWSPTRRDGRAEQVAERLRRRVARGHAAAQERVAGQRRRSVQVAQRGAHRRREVGPRQREQRRRPGVRARRLGRRAELALGHQVQPGLRPAAPPVAREDPVAPAADLVVEAGLAPEVDVGHHRRARVGVGVGDVVPGEPRAPEPCLQRAHRHDVEGRRRRLVGVAVGHEARRDDLVAAARPVRERVRPQRPRGRVARAGPSGDARSSAISASTPSGRAPRPRSATNASGWRSSQCAASAADSAPSWRSTMASSSARSPGRSASAYTRPNDDQSQKALVTGFPRWRKIRSATARSCSRAGAPRRSAPRRGGGCGGAAPR